MAAPEEAEQEEQYIRSLAVRVRSFESDPLHSAAYLRELVEYLQKPFRKKARIRSPTSQPPAHARDFVYVYSISAIARPEALTFTDVVQFRQHARNIKSVSNNELIFLAGQPSAAWLAAVGGHYGVDAQFFHQHLNFLPNSQRDWHASPSLPSRSKTVLRLCIPSMVFVGAEGRAVSQSELQWARKDCDDQVRTRHLLLANDSAADVGKSVVRRVNIHGGDCIVLEQELSVTVVRRREYWSILIWTDSGSDETLEYVPLPNTEGFRNIRRHVQFCPVFFENQSADVEASSPKPADAVRTKQPLSMLPSKYGLTLDWTRVASDPFYALHELLTFQAASASQYLNMVEKLLLDQMRDTKPPGSEGTKLEDILTFDYAQRILVRHAAHYRDIAKFVQHRAQARPWCVTTCPAPTPADDERDAHLHDDLTYLQERAETLIALCETGKSTLRSNASIEEAKRSAAEARLVTNLTKFTNRLTFIFLPISYVTSIFGMNFVQFGQGQLSMWVWAAVTFPLLLVCIILVETGPQLRRAIDLARSYLAK